MKKYWIVLLLLLSCCTPTITTKNNLPVVASGKFSCYNGQCCWPYLHHKDVKDYHLMLCTHETIRPDGWHSLEASVKTYFTYP